ncbi:GNAT family N-acetyltransferase [Bacillus inaquosorum]|uniref:GNAT family N-acetyltransferase n=1 Tax=Bacillus inaquosorum TaxID=483913 RepID=UPI0022815E88|nr:GNAT family N-acetyltransferase [Bacillus inaquosorum]MCY9030221.1 GNAT family N-acetyltransferase [Bacillus inaquosorum]MCY9058785.1 GNAT family N-acetyltransferase [Bacillus inaquosorum]MCY9063647.1 GNAT family N-acetyltransferase [Bacillus inaquosorum]MCY9076794.1 GNAT family N-acetyltransferase [Bacillus inaquosorum]MCY9094398.1 GNAT family N-acetyltransferase [Bacillus inaquosorum]
MVDIHKIEQLAAASWPSYIQKSMGQWLLRANFGVTKRANSVWTSADMPEGEFQQEAEHFYKSLGLPVCFHISNASPKGLDGALADSGYEKADECFQMTALCRDIMNRTEDNRRLTYKWEQVPSSVWIDNFIRLEGFSAKRHQGYSNIFKRMPPCKTFFTMYDQGSLTAVGTASVIEGYGGLSNIVAAKKHRGKGAGTQVIRVLTEWAISNGAKHMYLQVLKENLAAVSLYEKIGFSPISEHHYRIKK